MNHAIINHREKVHELAELITNRNTYGKPMYAIDVSRWGVSEPYSDCENHTVYRSTIFELSNDTFISENEEINEPHYNNAPYESIWDY